MSELSSSGPDTVKALATLLDLSQRARRAGSARELGFLLVNDSLELAPYRQAALWLPNEGLYTLSGLIQVEANAPYALWLEQVCAHLALLPATLTRTLTAADLPPELSKHWAEWWPNQALWLTLPAESTHPNDVKACGLLLVGDMPWPIETQTLLREWVDTWWHAFRALYRPQRWSWRALSRGLRTGLTPKPNRSWWRQPRWHWATLAIVVAVLPVRLTVLAPGELVPARPVVIRAPLDGVVDVFHVQPNQRVDKDQPLFGFDEALIQSRLEVANQTLVTAEAEYRQTSQQALTDAKFRPQLTLLTGKIDEKRTEVNFLKEQLFRARVLAPRDGVALFDDPTEWIGRPVAVGERIMRIAAPKDIEVEAWLPLADAIALPPGAPVDLYLNASPFSSVSATLRYMAHDAVQRPDGSYAYRVRAALAAPTDHRVGLKGTAKLHGPRVPLIYWVLRRPLASFRAALGV
jgi:hypothetical protein